MRRAVVATRRALFRLCRARPAGARRLGARRRARRRAAGGQEVAAPGRAFVTGSGPAGGISADDVPRLPRGVRLRVDTVRNATVLLAPERTFNLDPVAAAVLQ